MEPSFLPTPLPFTPNAKPAILSSNVFDGYWARKEPWLDGSTVLDQRTGLGTPRLPEPRRCLELNGTDQYGWIPIDPVTEYPFTLFGWVASNTGFPVALAKAGSNTVYWSIGNLNATILLRRQNGVELATDHSIPSAYGTGWQSFVLVYDSPTQATLYRNGELLSAVSEMADRDLAAGFLPDQFCYGVFRSNIPSGFFYGKSMHCGFLRRAATLADAQAFHTTGIIPDAEVFLPLDGNSTTVAYNIGTSNDTYPEATLVNGAAGMLYEGRDVPFSRQNEVGFSERRNLLFQTENMSISPWGKINDLTREYIGDIAPDGTPTASRITSTGNGILVQTIPVVTGNISVSIWVKAVSATTIRGLGWRENASLVKMASDIPMTGEWQKIEFTGISEAMTSLQFWLRTQPTASTVLVWHPQLELGSTVTPYQRILSDPGTNVKIPALLSDPTKSAATDPLTYTGKAHFDGALEQSNCLTFDGVDDYIAMDLSDIAGPELVTNGTFDTDLSGWSVGADPNQVIPTWDAGRVRLDSGSYAGGVSGFSQNCLTSGKFYLLRWDVISGTAATGDGIPAQAVGVGSHSRVFRAVATSALFRPNLDNSTCILDNISIRELPVITGEEKATDSSQTATFTASINGDSVTISNDLSGVGGVDDGRHFQVTFNVTSITEGSVSVRVKTGTNSALISTTGTHTVFVQAGTGTSTTIRTHGASTTATITDFSIKRVDLIQHDGTSLLTYRPQGDGIDGTAGTAFNIQLGDVEHIPCSEGAGDEVYGTKLNQAYQIVNGQASNWETKQDVYHYNITEGASRVDISEETDEQKVEELFAASEQGAVYDPSDFSTMFQDVAGTTPVTENGQTVALHLDKSKGLVPGPELVSNGTFDANLNGWTAGSAITAVWDAGEADLTLNFTLGNNFANWFSSGVVVPTGTATMFLVEFDATWVSGSSLQVGTAYQAAANIAPNGGVKTRYRAICGLRGGVGNVAIPASVAFGSTAAARWKIDNVTCKELTGNHRYQNTSASEPTKGRHPVSGVRNLLAWSEDLTNEVWLKGANTTVQVGVAAGPTGANNANRVVLPIGIGTYLQQPVGVVSGVSYVFSLWIKTNNAVDQADIGVAASAGSGLVSDLDIEATADWQRVSFTHTAASTGTLWFGIDNRSNTVATDILVADIQVELGSTPTPYQRVTNRFDITEEGQDDVHYLWYDGIDDFMETNAVDFTGTDKMTVWWGGRKLSDATDGILLEASANAGTNDGSFFLAAPELLLSRSYSFGNKGSAPLTLPNTAGIPSATFAAPSSNVITLIGDISAPLARIRGNGIVYGSGTGNQGTGNYGNHKLFFGRRAGTSISANIREYMTIIRGAETDIFTIQEIENVVARKVGLDEFHYEGNLYIPASQTNPGFDALGNPLTHPAVVGINAAETEVNYSPVDNSWPEQYSIPGADLPNYTFDGDPGDISLGIDTATREASFHLRTE